MQNLLEIKWIVFILIICSCVGLAQAELKLVIEVVRHGARSPLDYKPEYSFGEDWNIMAQDLTKIGERQHYLLGTKRRKHYIEDLQFLSPEYDPDELYVESSDRNRTIMSAYSYLKGMYPYGTGHSGTIENSEKEDAAVPPFEVSKLDFGSEPLEHKYYPIPVHVRKFHQGLMRGYEPEQCPARGEIHRKDFKISNREFGKIQVVFK